MYTEELIPMIHPINLEMFSSGDVDKYSKEILVGQIVATLDRNKTASQVCVSNLRDNKHTIAYVCIVPT